MSVHEAIAAVPTTASGDPVVKDLLHNLLIVRYPYVFEDDEDPSAWDAVDTETGSIPLAVVKTGVLYTLDADDTTTSAGATCIVTNDGKRYKSEAVDFDVRSVLDKDETDPPEDAELGDAYLVPSGASGDWGDHPDEIALFTSRGWVFISPKIGTLVLVEDEDTYYRLKANGDWEAGVGQSALSDNTVRSSHIIGGRTHWVVVNQTTNTPPGSPATGDTYIVGGTPTGAWSGHTAKIAQYSGSAWLIYSPAEGWTAYDQNLNSTYVYSGSSWVSQAGAIIFSSAPIHTRGTGSTTLNTGTGTYTFSTTAPDTAKNHSIDDVGVTHTARKTNAWLRLFYSGRINGIGNQNHSFAVAVLRDSEPNAIDWKFANWNAVISAQVNVMFDFQAPDTSSHTYKVAFFAVSATNQMSSIDARTISIQEFA